MWRDVFVQQTLPWGRFLQSALLHTTAVALIWTISLAWIRQQKILDRPAFDRSSLVTYTPEEYLPPLDTGASEAPKAQKGDPAYAKQPILSVPPEADNRSQTIVVPPDLKLNHDVPLPNIVATGAIVPAVPLDATRASLSRMVAPETQVVAPAPDVQFARDRVVQAGDEVGRDCAASGSDVPSDARLGRPGDGGRGTASGIDAVDQRTSRAHEHWSECSGGAGSAARAGRTACAVGARRRKRGSLAGGGVQPVGPPPSVAASGGGSAGGRLIALGIHPVAPTGPVAVPAGNRRGTFAATPQGKPGASGTPDLAGSKSTAKGSGVAETATAVSTGARTALCRLACMWAAADSGRRRRDDGQLSRPGS